MAMQVSKVNVAAPETITEKLEHSETATTENAVQAQAKQNQAQGLAFEDWHKFRMDAQQDIPGPLPNQTSFKRPDGAGGGNVPAALVNQGSPGDQVELTPIQIPRTATAAAGLPSPGESVTLTPIQMPRTNEGDQLSGKPNPGGPVELNQAAISPEDKLNEVGDAGQLANVGLQDALQKQQQALEMLSDISKNLSDTAMATIRKIGS